VLPLAIAVWQLGQGLWLLNEVFGWFNFAGQSCFPFSDLLRNLLQLCGYEFLSLGLPHNHLGHLEEGLVGLRRLGHHGSAIQ